MEEGTRRSFSKKIPVPLDGQRFVASVEFQPKPDVKRELPEFFDKSRSWVERSFWASYSGLITDPEEITLPAELVQLVYSPDRKDPTHDQNRYIAMGRGYDKVLGKHGWLIIDPVLSSTMVVASRLPQDGSSGASFITSCYLGDRDLDGELYRLFCVFSDDAEALEIEQELIRGKFDWSPFVRTKAQYKVNDGDDGFDQESDLRVIE